MCQISLPHLTDSPHSLKLINGFLKNIYAYIHYFEILNSTVLCGNINK